MYICIYVYIHIYIYIYIYIYIHMYIYIIFIRYALIDAQRHAHNETFAVVVSYDHYTLTHTSSQTDTHHERTDTRHIPIPANAQLIATHNSLQLIASHCNSIFIHIYTHILTKRHQTHPNSCPARLIATHCKSLQLIATHCNSIFIHIYTHTSSQRDTRHIPIAATHISLQVIATHCNSISIHIYTHILTKRDTTHPNSCTTQLIASHCNSLELYIYTYIHTHSHKETHDTPQ